MNSDKKLYLYSGLAIASAILIYIVVTKNKKSPITSNETKDENEEAIVVTPSGDTISEEQNTIQSDLQNILKLPLAQIKLKMLNQKLYTKVDNVNPRQTPYVNNGWFVNNGVGGRITQKGTFAGIVTDVSKDQGLLKNTNGNVYTWFKIKPSSEAIEQIKNDRNILLGTKTDTFWLREDTIILKK